MLAVTKVSDSPKFGMTVQKGELPMLVHNSKGVIALLVNWNENDMCNYEADAILLMNGDLFGGFKSGMFVKKLNLEFFLPYDGKLTIANFHK